MSDSVSECDVSVSLVQHPKAAAPPDPGRDNRSRSRDLNCRAGFKFARRGREGSAPLLAALAAMLLAGCETVPPLADQVMGPGYQPENVYRHAVQLPEELRRVAVLPLTTADSGSTGEAGREALEPVLRAELGKARNFELILVSAEQLRHLTGRPDWTAEEPLPPDFFTRLRDALGCDGVLFSRLTVYRPYAPLALGWNLKLVDGRQSQIWWSADEVFDAGEPAVANAARRYYQAHVLEKRVLAESRSILESPRRFGQYTVDALLATLPVRAFSAKVSSPAADNSKRIE